MTTTASPSTRGAGLAKASMSGFEVLAQSVAGIAPSAVMATGPALVALGAGGSILYSYLFSTLILLMVGYCIAQFARRNGHGASLMSYIISAFGPGVGFIGAIGLAFGYTMIGLACLGGITLYLQPLLLLVGVPGVTSTATTIVTMVVVMALAAVAMIRGVQLSTRIGLVLEVLSVVCIVAVIIAVFATSGFSTAPLTPSDLGPSGVAGGMVLAILGYVGFESAACMGTEAADPQRTIPRAVLGSALIVGLLYLLSGYAQLVGFGDAGVLSADAAPLNKLADNAGVHPLGYLVDVGAVASFFACVTGSLNAASRLLHAMGTHGLLPQVLGGTHAQHRTPQLAIVSLSVLAGGIGIAATLMGQGPLDIFAVAGTIGTYGYMVAYLLVSLGAAVFLARRGEPFLAAALLGGLATAGMLYVLYRSVWPVPPAPYNALPWVFLAIMVGAGAWYASIRSRIDFGLGLTEVAEEMATEVA